MNLDKHRRAIERTYVDRATISRYVEVDKQNGSKGLELLSVYTDKPCRISQKSLGANGQSEAQNDIAYEIKLFISPDIEIKQGDEIEVTRQGTKRGYTAGEPFTYPTHQEVSLQRKEKA